MNALSDTESNPIPTTDIRVSKLGSDVRNVVYAEGMTVGDCLAQTETLVGRGETITVNADIASPADHVPAGAVIVVANKVDNG